MCSIVLRKYKYFNFAQGSRILTILTYSYTIKQKYLIKISLIVLHTSCFAHILFCTHLVLHTSCFAHFLFCTHLVLHTSCFAHILFCTHLVLHTSCFAHILFCTHLVLHTSFLHTIKQGFHTSLFVCLHFTCIKRINILLTTEAKYNKVLTHPYSFVYILHVLKE